MDQRGKVLRYERRTNRREDNTTERNQTKPNKITANAMSALVDNDTTDNSTQRNNIIYRRIIIKKRNWTITRGTMDNSVQYSGDTTCRNNENVQTTSKFNQTKGSEAHQMIGLPFTTEQDRNVLDSSAKTIKQKSTNETLWNENVW